MTNDVELSRSLMIMDTKDNVAVCLRALSAGEEIQVTHNDKILSVKVLEAVPLGHKIALSQIASGQPITKYGEIIGRAIQDIFIGQHVHNHNVSDY
jgi:altronate dehydratase